MKHTWLAWLAPCVGADFLMAGLAGSPWTFDSARWYRVHLLSNLGIAYVTAGPFVRLLTSPSTLTALRPHPGLSDAVKFAMALHLYHCVAWRLRPSDVWHHVTSVLGAGLATSGLPLPLQSSLVWVGCGLPGGLDYLGLCLRKSGWVGERLQRKWTAVINMMLRAPVGALVSHWVALHAYEARSYRAAAVAVVAFVNVAYYNHQAARSYERSAAAGEQSV